MASYEDFLGTVDSENRDFVEELHKELIGRGLKLSIKEAANGFMVSYIGPKSNKTLLNYVMRKSGIKVRIYGMHVPEYENFLCTLPTQMKKNIDKAQDCKRLLNPADCNPKCTMGYSFILDGKQMKKCKNMAFFHDLSTENNPFIHEFVLNELRIRELSNQII